jgi:hypothetical protein
MLFEAHAVIAGYPAKITRHEDWRAHCGYTKTSVRSTRAMFSKLFRAGFDPRPRFDLHCVFDFIAVAETGEQHAGANDECSGRSR